MVCVRTLVILVVTLGFVKCSQSDSKSLTGTKELDFEIQESINTDDLHNNNDFDKDDIIDFNEAFGFVTQCPPPSYTCSLRPVAVRLSPKQFKAFCAETASDEQSVLMIDLICKKEDEAIIEKLSSGAAYIRIGALFEVTGLTSVAKGSETDKLIIGLKAYPKDTREIYSILDPFDSLLKDSDGDSLIDAVELGLPIDESNLEGYERYRVINSPGNRPSVAAVPVMRIVANEVLVTPEVTTSEGSSNAQTLQEQKESSTGGSISIGTSVEIGAAIYGPISRTTYSLTYSQNWGKSVSELDATTLTEVYGRSFNEAHYATVTPSGFLVNIGTAPIVRSTLQAPSAIAGTPLGSVAFRYFWDGTNATTTPSQDQTFVREDAFYMTREQYRQFFIGAPIEWDLNLIEGDIYNEKDYSQIQNMVALRNASVIWEGKYLHGRTGREYELPYQQYIFAGGNRPSTTVNASNVALPIVPVTLKDALVATMGYHEIWTDDAKTGDSYIERVEFREGPKHWKDDRKGVSLDRVRLVSNFSNGPNGNGARNPWIMKTEGGRLYYKAKDKKKQQATNDYARLLGQVIRPQDQFFLSISNVKKEATIEKAVVVEREGGGSVVSVLVDALRLDSVRIREVQNGQENIRPLTASNQDTGVKLFEYEYEDSELEGISEIFVEVLLGDEVVAYKQVISIIAKDKKPQPRLLDPIVGGSQGQYSHHQVPGLEGGVPIMKSFLFSHSKDDQDRPFRGISVIPSRYARIDKPNQSSIMQDDRYLSTALFDRNGDDNYDFEHEYVVIDDSTEIKVSLVEAQGCSMSGRSGCRLEVSIPEDHVFALVGFELAIADDSDFVMKGLFIEPGSFNGKHYVDVGLYEWDRKFNANIAYAAVPKELLVTSGASTELSRVSGTGVSEALNSQVLKAPGIKILRGFKLEFTGAGSGHIAKLGFKFGAESADIGAFLSDDTEEREFYYHVDYAFLKKDI